MRWVALLVGVLHLAPAIGVEAQGSRPTNRRAIAMFLEESNTLSRQTLEMLARSAEKSDLKRAKEVVSKAYLKLNGALLRSQIIQEKQRIPDPLLDHVVKRLNGAREHLRQAASQIGEATGPEQYRAQHMTTAAGHIRRSINLCEQAAAFL